VENKASYFFVGLFVFLGLFAGTAFILWLGGASKKDSFEFYEIYTQESVAGLGIKAPVRFLGVEVGSVEDIEIVDENDLEVKILIKVKKGTPIKEDTFASLGFGGITGLKFIQLQGGSKESPALMTNSTQIAVIKFKEGFFSEIEKQSEHISSLVKTADLSSKKLFSDKNLQNLEIFLENLATLSINLNTNSKDLSKDFSVLLKHLNQSLKKIDESINSADELFKKSSLKLDGIDELRLALLLNSESFQNLITNANTLILNLQKSPSDLLFKETKPKPAPGEK